jgi:dolichol-phosphate mannosyltransferase
VELRPRQGKYCTVICVIDEGERIGRQLARMSEAAGVPDIVVADGGSEDGSTDPDLLERLGVRTLLVMEDDGALGAQLRMAWAYALREGYEGVVTVDGNDKDDVRAIPQFVRALDEGWDFIQGSRFLPGGRAVNTPISRLVAMRALHSPLVSMAAGFRFTDTTNAFRAHSRRLLLHPGLQPFRPVFQRYELLAYLSVRAPRLGLRVKEIPVGRCYPERGVPTKISPLRGNMELAGTLVKAVIGRFDPS